VSARRVETTAVVIRTMRRSGTALIRDAFAHLSTRSRRLRFVGTESELSPRELAYFTRVDRHDHEAVVAVTGSAERIIGGARYVRACDDPRSPAIAVAVIDKWQVAGSVADSSPASLIVPPQKASIDSPRTSRRTTQ
jgi:hypothetical protein